MAFGFDLTELADKLSVFINHESAALNAHHFLAIHVLFFDHIKEFAQLFFFIRQQLKFEVILADKLIMRLQAVTRYTYYFSVLLFELRQQFIKLNAFSRASWS